MDSVTSNIFRKIILYLFSFNIFCSLNPWFAWNIPIKYILLFCCFCCLILVILTNKGNDKIKKKSLTLFFVYIIIIIYSYIIKVDYTITNFIVAFYYIGFFFIFILLTEPEKVFLKECVLNLFAGILIISLFLYFLVVVLNVNLPYTSLTHETLGYNVQNYGFLVMGLNRIRFQCIFTEPGHLGMISAFLLFMNKYNFKDKRNVVFLVSCIVSFSLASYLLLFMGVLFYLLIRSKKFIRNLFIIGMFGVLLIGIGVSISKKYPDSILTVLILSRLQFDSSKGISGNNRTSYSFDKEYKKLAFTEKLTGLPKIRLAPMIDKAGTSYKIYIVTYGYLGILFLLSFFLPITLSSRNKKYAICCFLLYTASFLQRPYILWPIETYLYILTIEEPVKRKVLNE